MATEMKANISQGRNNMKANTKSNLSLLLVSAFLMFSAGIASANSTDSDSCVSCHQSMIDNSMIQASSHQPFLNGQCTLCHGGSEASGTTLNSSEAAANSTPRIKWLDKNPNKANVQWFRIPSGEVKNALYIASNDRKTSNIRLDIPEKKNLTAMDNDNVPPIIHDVQVVNIEKGLFIIATIAWKTDKISDSLVNFNTGERNTKSYDSRLTTDHKVALIGLKADHQYTYTVASTDVFGNVSQSEGFTFSTSGAKPANKNTPFSRSKGKAKITSEIFTANDNLIVKVSTDRPAALAIGTDMHAKPKKIRSNSTDVASDIHGNMRVNINKTVALCLSCHKDHKGAGSHPVDVYPTRGMIIPADYPTSAEGKITCLTCHEAHASNLNFMLRKSQGRELCIGCHRDKATDRPAKGLMVNLTTRKKNS